MKGRGDQKVFILSTPTVRRHSLGTDLGVIMTALDGGALTSVASRTDLPHRRGRGLLGRTDSQLASACLRVAPPCGTEAGAFLSSLRNNHSFSNLLVIRIFQIFQDSPELQKCFQLDVGAVVFPGFSPSPQGLHKILLQLMVHLCQCARVLQHFLFK
jgi:hypothetical protein